MISGGRRDDHPRVVAAELDHRNLVPATGERYAISLAVARNLPLLVEDRKARLAADRLGLRSTGALGMILAAREAGRLSTMEAKAGIEALHQSGRISGHLQDMALARVIGH